MHAPVRSAFTLVELLVVIAIIAVIAAILFPVFMRAREAARATVCVSNMKQISLGLQLYAQDADDTWPRMDACIAPASDPLGSGATGCYGPYGQRVNHYKWEAWIYPYVRNVQVFFCPSRRRDETYWRDNGEIYNGYALNLSITGSTDTLGRPDGVGAYRNSWTGGTLAGLQAPAETMLVMEHWFPGVWSYVTPDGVRDETAYPLATREVWENALRPGGVTNTAAAAHNDGLNLAYCDQHVKHLALGAFLAQCPPAGEYPVSSVPSPFPSAMVYTIAAPPTWSRPWPLWGLL